MLAGVALAACSNEDLTPENGNAISFGEEVNIETTIESNYDCLPVEDTDEDVQETRATVNTEDMSVLFQEGDKMSVTNGTLTALYSLEATGSSAQFKIKDNNMLFAGELDTESKFYSIYPAEAVLGWNGSTATMCVYAEQDYTENTNQTFGGYMASVGSDVTTNSVHFNYRLIGSIIDINLKTLGVTPASVSIKTNSGVSIAGHFKFDCATGTTIDVQNEYGVSGYNATSQSDVITVSNINKQVDYVRFYVLPTVLTDGITITVRDTEGNYYTKKTSTPIGTAATEGLTEQNNITGGTIAKAYYKKVNFGAADTAKRLGNWMAAVPSNISYFMVSVPGAHNSAAYGDYTLVVNINDQVKTNDLTFEQQLAAGIRAFDLRPYVTTTGQKYANTMLYHGSQNTNINFKDAMDTFSSFLTNNPTESIILIMHDEKGDNKWGQTVMEALGAYDTQIAKITTNMKLAAARGKMIVIVRDDVSTADTDLCGKVGWGSSFDDKTVLKGYSSASSTGCILRYQDEYTNAQYANRLTNAVRMLNEIRDTYNADANRIFVNTINTEWTLGGTGIPTSAKKNNDAVINSTEFQNSDWRWGIIIADYMGSNNYSGKTLMNMVVNQNFKYVYKNRTRNTGAATEGIGIGVAGDEYADEGTVYVKEQRNF